MGQGSITYIPGRQKPYWARLPASHNRRSLGCYRSHSEAAEALGKAMYGTSKPQSSEQKPMALKDLYERFASSPYYEQLSDSGRQSHRSAWGHLSSCSRMPVANINAEVFQGVINKMARQGKKRETLSKVRNLASLLCAFCGSERPLVR